MSWDSEFAEPIDLPNKLVATTLRQVIGYIHQRCDAANARCLTCRIRPDPQLERHIRGRSAILGSSARHQEAWGLRNASTVAVAPTREEITTAYQSALQGRAPVAAPPVTAPPARKLAADELATLLNTARARSHRRRCESNCANRLKPRVDYHALLNC